MPMPCTHPGAQLLFSRPFLPAGASQVDCQGISGGQVWACGTAFSGTCLPSLCLCPHLQVGLALGVHVVVLVQYVYGKCLDQQEMRAASLFQVGPFCPIRVRLGRGTAGDHSRGQGTSPVISHLSWRVRYNTFPIGFSENQT